jgi:hypothetical protein
MANRDDIRRAVQSERDKVHAVMVYWYDKDGNCHIVPVVRLTDGGERWCIEIPPPTVSGEHG